MLVCYLLIALIVFVALSSSNIISSDSSLLLVIWCVSLSLLLSSVLVSNNLTGYDIHDEYFMSTQVLKTGKWDIAGTDMYNSVISITLLPAMLALLSGLSDLVIHKLLLPFVYSLMPVVLYKVYRGILTQRGAFFSIFLFMSFSTFYDEMIQLGRQIVGELLLALLILIMLSPRLNRDRSGVLLVILLTIGLVTAHYSLAYLFMIFLAFSFVVSRVFRTATLVTGIVFVATIVIGFGWYAYIAGGVALAAASQPALRVLEALTTDFFSSSSRPAVVLLALGLKSGMTGILHNINRVTQYLVQLLLILGFFTLLRRKHKTRTEEQMFPLVTMAFVFIGAAVVLPFFWSTLQFTRIYHIALLFASPCLVYGMHLIDLTATRVWSYVRGTAHLPTYSHRRVSFKSILMAGILFSYFIFNSGWVWAVTLDRPTSHILEPERFRYSGDPTLTADYYHDFTTPSDIVAAQWLSYYHVNGHPVCADQIQRYHVLNSYGGFPRQDGADASHTFPYECDIPKSYVFLSEYNNLFAVVETGENPPDFGRLPISVIGPKLALKDRIFSDGGALMYL